MTNVEDLNIIENYFHLFNHTLNDDAKYKLKEILSTPLQSLVKIHSRQHILKTIIHSELAVEYKYHKTDYAESYYFLNLLDSKNFKNVDYLTYLFQKSTNNRLIGHYIQLSYFFKELNEIFNKYLDVKAFEKLYQNDLHFIKNYINSFQFKKLHKQTIRGKLKYSSVTVLNSLVLEKRKNGDTKKFYDLLNEFEGYISIAAGIKKLGFVFPEFTSDEFEILQMFHPLLDSPVKNDFQNVANVILLTGANMSGKSTFLKTVSIIVHFAHLGVAVPALSAKLPFYDYISIHINHSDDIKNGLSHFMQEIVNMKNVLKGVATGKRCFAVFDELFKGTNYQDAFKISLMTINALQDHAASKFLISTHIYEMKDQIHDKGMIAAMHLDCTIEDNYPRFTYQLKEGWTDLKIGELLFEREGLKELLKVK